MSKTDHPAVAWALTSIQGAKAALVNAHAALEYAEDELKGKKKKGQTFERHDDGEVGPA